MRHVFVCTTEYGDHWAKTIARKQAQLQAMSEEDRRRILSATPEEHADGHRGLHCGQTLGGRIYERYQARLRDAGIDDVIVSPNACVAQHAYGCVVMVYPDGLWYRIRQFEDAERVLEEHIIGGRPVLDLVHRRLNPPTGRGVTPPAHVAAPGGAGA
jgi:(2Fe-2S) ferredoxin